MAKGDGFGVAFIVVWVLSLLLSIAVVGVIIWAVVQLVQWLVTK